MAGANDPAKDEGIWKWAQPVLTAVGSIAGLVIIVHLLGGIVMWLRFSKAGLPADQAIAVMTREQILAVGLRVMVLPALVSAGVAAALVWNDEQPKTLVLVLRIVAVAVAAILFLTLPVSWASVTWLALLLVFVYWWRGFGATRRRGRPSPWRLAAIAVLAAAIISLGRQIDEPVQLLQADVMLRPGAAARQVHGVFISQDVTTVYLGDVASGQIEELPRDEVASLDLGPPLARAPNRSLLSMVLGDHWSLTPLHWWCDGQSYTWFRLGRLCRTQPKARPDRRELDIRWIPVRVTCPRAAGDGCHGYLRTRTRETYSTALGPFAMSRRVSFPRDGLDGVEFSMSAGRAREICVPTSPAERSLLRAPPDGRRRATTPVPVELIVSSDPGGTSVMSRQQTLLDVAPSGADASMINSSDCSTQLRQRFATQAAPLTAVASAVGVLDAHNVLVRQDGREKLVRLLGITSPASPAFAKPKCGEREGVDTVLRLLFTQPRDTDRDGLADHGGGQARRLVLTPDPSQPNRDRTSRLLRYVSIAGQLRTVQGSILRAGWATLAPGAAKLARGGALERAARAGAQAGLTVLC